MALSEELVTDVLVVGAGPSGLMLAVCLAKQGVDVIGISPDKPSAQQKFDTKYGLGFPLLADEDHTVASAFGVWGEKSMYGRKYMGIIRSAFLIDEKGTIAGAWYGVSPKDTVPGALAALG